MKPLRKLISSLLIVALIVSFSGCRKKPEEKPADYSGIELTYYKVFDDSDIFEPMIAEFQKQRPGLVINYKKFSDFDEYQRTILNEMAEGEGPDIFSMPNTWFVSNYKKISPMPESLGTTEKFDETFVDVAYKDLVRPDADGYEQIYALPMTVDALSLYYNDAHFEDRLPEQGRPSATWEGIKDDVVSLNKEDSTFDRFEVSGIAMGRADNITRGVDIFYLLLLQYGAEFYNENISDAIFASQQGLGNYPGLEALDFYTSFADSSQKHYSWNEFTADDDSDSQEIAAFAKGEVSMILGFAYTYDLILDQINSLDKQGFKVMKESEVKIAPVPQLYDPKVSTDKRVTYASYFAETVSRNSKHPDIAWDFLRFLTTRENLQYYFDETHNPTSRRDLIAEQKADPIFGVFASQIGFAESFPIPEYYVYKGIFTDLISETNNSGPNKGNVGLAEGRVDDLLPPEGYLVPVVEKPKNDE